MKRPYYGWVLAVVLGACETVSWGVLYYAFSVLIAPTTAELGWSRAAVSGPAFATAAGLILHRMRPLGAPARRRISETQSAGLFGRLGLWLKENF